MGRIEQLIRNYEARVALPWEAHLPGPQRVWFAVYPPAEERRLRQRLEEFEIATSRARHGWLAYDLTDAFAQWLVQHDYREAYFQTPEILGGNAPTLDEFKDHLVGQVKQVLTSERADHNTVVALYGLAGLFGFVRISELVARVESAIRGRLLVFFPGEYEHYTYRLPGGVHHTQSTWRSPLARLLAPMA